MSTEPEIDGEVPAKVVGLDDARARRSKRRSEWPSAGEDNKPVHKSQQNVRHFLEQIGCELFFDAFASRHMVTWNGRTAALDDATLLVLYFRADAMGLRPSKAWFTDCLVNFANLNQRNDVRARIDALQLKWDEKPRLDGWLVRHAGGEDTALAFRRVRALPENAIRRLISGSSSDHGCWRAGSGEPPALPAWRKPCRDRSAGST